MLKSWPGHPQTSQIPFKRRKTVFVKKSIFQLLLLGGLLDELEVFKTWQISRLFSRPNNSNFTDTDSYDFSASPQPPQALQTCFNNRFLGLLAWRDSKVHASFRTAGTVLHSPNFNFTVILGGASDQVRSIESKTLRDQGAGNQIPARALLPRPPEPLQIKAIWGIMICCSLISWFWYQITAVRPQLWENS